MTQIRHNKRSHSAFTLVETLLSVVLVGLLVTAVVVNFVGMEKASKLNEGATQVEALFRFARAHAATTGKIVQIRATEAGETTNAPSRPSLEVVCESDPVRQPGEFKPVQESKMFVDQIQQQVCVEELKIVQADEAARAEGEDIEMDEEEAPISSTTFTSSAQKEPMPAISFFPDGSSDSAEIVLLSLAEEEPRKVLLRLSGIVGTVNRNPIYSSNYVENSAVPADISRHSHETVLR
ncbi:MAG TPA: GspH/FimT family pseudopilin [Methylomirabilota bacterium]|nr:GspH/FimT family pseudopilin [Methylomirabilota bacterium]